MSRLLDLKAATSLSDLAKLLAFKPKAVSYILYKTQPTIKYSTFLIPKRAGGYRTIKAPNERLKLLQSRLSDLPQDCVDDINKAKGRKDRAAHGFKRGRSIITNAHRHRHRRWVFNLDLEDFFPSINFGRVLGFFVKNRDFHLHRKVATVIAQIACHDNSLPQGSPCSPVISNLIAHLLDMRLVTLAAKVGCTYSRYADDLTFSTNKREFPQDIAVQLGAAGASAHSWTPSTVLQRTIERTGFRINVKKTRMMYRTSRQQVTGLVTNAKINTRWEYRHDVRAMVHRLTRSGEFEILGLVTKDGGSVSEKRPGTRNELQGMLGFIDAIDRSRTNDRQSGDPSANQRVYREFLIYDNFYAAATPVVICEGETDNVYLTHAIRRLAPEFPDLVEIAAGGKIRLKVRLYKYAAHRRTAELLGLRSGGNSRLAAFIAAYKKEAGRFGGPEPTSPVVILYDNDSGAKAVNSAIRAASGRQPTGAAPFVHVVKNMYAVPTPGTNSKIENFFDEATRATKLDGKSFNSDNAIDPDTEYGKKVFAYKVVRATADKIDFGGFRPLLTNLVAAINEHAKPKTP